MHEQRGHASPVLVVASAVSAALAIGIVGTTIFGVIRAWHPAPLGDAWDGILRSWYRLQEVGLPELWAQHNEHRIVLGRLFGWLDLYLTGGVGWSLVVASLLILAGTTALIVWLMYRHLADADSTATRGPAVVLLASAVIATSWSWLNSENLLWIFQVSFFAVVALSLGSFGLIAWARTRAHGRGRTVALTCAAVLALIAPWAIPAGLATPLLAAVLAAFLRIGRRFVYLLTLGGVASAILYAIGFVNPGLAGTLPGPFDDPIAGIAFLLAYLGGPFAVAFGSITVGVALGAVFVTLTIGWVVLTARSGPTPVFGSALCAFLVFTIVEGLFVMMGRTDRGIDAAVVLRYQSLLVVAWACLIALWAPFLLALIGRRPALGSIAVLLAPAALVLWQPWALADPADLDAARDRALLAVALGAHDLDAIQPLYPDTGIVDDVLPRLQADGLTLLAREPYAALRAAIGLPGAGGTSSAGCRFTTGETTMMPHDGLSRIELSGDSGELPTGLVQIVDGSGVIAGYADVQAHSVFGYVLDATAPPFTLVSDGLACVMEG